MSWRSDFSAGAVPLVVSATLLATTWDDSYVSTGVGAAYSTVFYPRIILLIAMLAALQILIVALLNKTSTKRSARGRVLAGGKAAAITILCTVGYVVLLPQIGFPIVSVLLIGAVGWATGFRRWWFLGAVAVLVPVAIWLVAVYLLKIPLPGGKFF